MINYEADDEDEETDLEAYTTAIDNEDSVDEYAVFKQCLLSKCSVFAKSLFYTLKKYCYVFVPYHIAR